MIDKEGRKIEYLRISVTDRCNFRCRYCMPETGIACVSHSDILTYDEITRLVKLFSKLGISKVKITGGEPLIRKGVASLIKDIKSIDGIKEVTLTTNGFFLEEALDDKDFLLLDGINVSLDTLDRDKFNEITRFDGLEKVLKGIDKAISTSLKVKINVVSLRDFNYSEVSKLALLTKDRDISLRFIELMPIGLGKENPGYSKDEALEVLRNTFGKEEEEKGTFGNGPAKYYSFPNFKGKVGFISSVTHSFCSDCNRVRLTSEGFLKPCLYSDTGLDLRELLRSGKDDSYILDEIREEIFNKPKAHGDIALEKRLMSKIGG